MRTPFSSVLCAAAVLAGCMTSTDPAMTLAARDVPPAWEGDVTAPIWPDANWWQGFGSAELNATIAAVQDGNLSLAAAEERLIQADTRVRQAGSALLPNIGAGANASGRLNEGAGGSSSSSSFGANANISYELDFWGRNRAGLNAAEAARRATRADRETVALTAVTGAAKTYFQLLSLRDRLAVARLNLEIARSVLEVTQSRVRNGVATPLELAQQLGAIASQEAAIPQLEQQELAARAALAVLTGKPPQGFEIAARDLSALQLPPVNPGLPSDFLLRRPDITGAEAGLAGAHADVAAARAALFPSISLTAGGGASSASLVSLISDPSLSLSIGASLAQTIFDGGARTAGIEAAEAREREILANYRATVIEAFSEVQIALGNVANLAEQERYQIEQAVQAQRAFDIIQARYREGAADFLTVLDGQRTLYQSRDALGQIKLSRLQALINLYRALGGGWQAPEGD